jgi:hypothetical protein
MTLVIELEQRFESVAQVDQRAHGSWCNLSNSWCLRKIETKAGGRRRRELQRTAAQRRRFRGAPKRETFINPIAEDTLEEGAA